MTYVDNAFFWNGPLADTYGHVPLEHDRLIISDRRVNDEAFKPNSTLKSPEDRLESFLLYRYYCTYYLPVYTYEDGSRVFAYNYTPDTYI